MDKGTKNMLDFLDVAGPKVMDALKSTDPVEFNKVMDKVFADFMNLDIGSTRKPRTAKPKRKVKRGIGSY
jgi:hypothetical protein